MHFKEKIQSSLKDIYQPYKGILLDAYGVFWNGNSLGLIPGAKEAMERCVEEGKIVGILSNSSQPAMNEVNKIQSHGLMKGKHFHFYLTSGEIARSIFNNESLPFETLNKKYYVLFKDHPSFSSHDTLFAQSSFLETKNLHEADFIYLSVPHIDGVDQTDIDVFNNKILAFKQAKLPIVCVNPDHYAFEGSPARAYVRQGAIAYLFEKQGHDVFYIGKPSQIMFHEASKMFNMHEINNKSEILMVGDTPETDIKGASQYGMPSALITQTGIMADRIHRDGFQSAFASFQQYSPKHLIERLGCPL